MREILMVSNANIIAQLQASKVFIENLPFVGRPLDWDYKLYLRPIGVDLSTQTLSSALYHRIPSLGILLPISGLNQAGQ